MKKNKNLIILCFIFILALFLRTYKLGSLPFNFYDDEVLSVYLGRYILENGRDLYGNPWPLLYFNKFNDYYIILPMYLAGLSTYIFGVNDFAARLPVALIGALAIFAVYKLSKLLFFNNKKKERIALFAALLLAICPWHVVLSRTMVESVIESTLLILAIYFLLSAIHHKDYKKIFPASILFLLSYFIYHTARFYVAPLFFVAIFLNQLINKRLKIELKKINLILIANFLFFSVLTVYILSTAWGKGRFDQVSILSNATDQSIRNQEMVYNLPQGSFVLAKVFQNKYLVYFYSFINEYFKHLSFHFLLIDGWQGARYAVQQMGPIYFSTLFLAIAASYLLIKNKACNYLLLFLIFILFLSPIPASLTTIESPNIRRSILLIFPIIILAAYAFSETFEIKTFKNSLGFLFILILTAEFIHFVYLYSFHFDRFTSTARSDGFRELVDYSIVHQEQYDKIHLPTRGIIPIYYLYRQKDFSIQYSQQFAQNAYIKQIGNLYFYENSCPSEILDLKMLGSEEIIIQEKSCTKNILTEEIDEIYGLDILTPFKVLKPL